MALTFRGGPSPQEWALLEVLQSVGAQCTLFWYGSQAPGFGRLAAAALSQENEIGCAGWKPGDQWRIAAGAGHQVLGLAHEALMSATRSRVAPYLQFRGGVIPSQLPQVLSMAGFSAVVLGSIDGWALLGGTPAEALARLRPGDILVFCYDDARLAGEGQGSQWLKRLAVLLAALRRAGWRMLSVSGLAALTGVRARAREPERPPAGFSPAAPATEVEGPDEAPNGAEQPAAAGRTRGPAGGPAAGARAGTTAGAGAGAADGAPAGRAAGSEPGGPTAGAPGEREAAAAQPAAAAAVPAVDRVEADEPPAGAQAAAAGMRGGAHGPRERTDPVAAADKPAVTEAPAHKLRLKLRARVRRKTPAESGVQAARGPAPATETGALAEAPAKAQSQAGPKEVKAPCDPFEAEPQPESSAQAEQPAAKVDERVKPGELPAKSEEPAAESDDWAAQPGTVPAAEPAATAKLESPATGGARGPSAQTRLAEGRPAPLRYGHLLARLNRLADRSKAVYVMPIGRSVMGREIPAVRLGRGPRRVLLCAAHHGTDWPVSQVLLRFLEHVVGAAEAGEPLPGNDGSVLNGSALLEEISVWAIPVVNPDGVELCTGGLETARPYRHELLRLNGGSDDFCSWRANVRGVDLQRQYDAGWKTAADRLPQSPGPVGYPGTAPESEPEVQAVIEFCRTTAPRLAVECRLGRGEILWEYEGHAPAAARDLALALVEASGYRPLRRDPQGPAGGGFFEWFVKVVGRPAVSVRMGEALAGPGTGETGEEPAWEATLALLLAAARGGSS